LVSDPNQREQVDVDIEIAALEACTKALLSLEDDIDAQKRVLEYLRQRFASEDT
jgi:hypothetical protein